MNDLTAAFGNLSLKTPTKGGKKGSRRTSEFVRINKNLATKAMTHSLCEKSWVDEDGDRRRLPVVLIMKILSFLDSKRRAEFNIRSSSRYSPGKLKANAGMYKV